VKELHITRSLLPIECYASKRNNYQPRLLEHKGIVQHFISDKRLPTERAFSPEASMAIFKEYKVSAHFLIDRVGAIYQLVPMIWQAWHAGESQFMGRQGCNKFMIGIENIGAYNVPFDDAQYESNAILCAWLKARYGFELEWITGHETVAPGRKRDPGPSFDWQKLYELIYNYRDAVVYGIV
jgi:N-acetyl-anhydromuramyl-L-alanine amidase AmpD